MKHSQIDGVAQMVVVLTNQEMSCLVVSMFDDLVGHFRINICDIKIFACGVCFNTLSAKHELSSPLFCILYAKDEITRPSGKFIFENFSAVQIAIFY